MGKRPDQHRAKGIGGISPEIVRAAGRFNVLAESKRRPIVRAILVIRKPHQDARKRQTDKPRILGRPERPPANILRRLIGPAQIQWAFQIRKIAQSQKRRMHEVMNGVNAAAATWEIAVSVATSSMG